MFVLLAQENLFDDNTSSAPATTAPTATDTTVNTGSGFNLDLSNTILSNDSIRNFIYHLNSFVVAWCIFYSVLFIIDFFFYRMRFNEGAVDREKIGVKSLERAFKIWFSYLFCWLALVIYGYFPVIGLLTVLVYFGKLLYVDLPVILDIIHDYMGLNGVHSNYRKMVSPIIKLLKMDFKK